MTATTRPNAPLITGSERFSAVWPQVFSDVVRLLTRRGVEVHAAEDAAQEAGTRAFDLNVPFDDAADLRRWVLTAAKRIAIDDARRSSRIDRHADVDTSSKCDVHAETEGRLRLEAVRDAFPRLSAGERAAISSDAPASTTRTEAVRLAVRRHRARTHLLQLIEGVAAIALVVWRKMARPATVAFAAAPIVAVILVTRSPLATDEAPGRDAIVAEPQIIDLAAPIGESSAVAGAGAHRQVSAPGGAASERARAEAPSRVIEGPAFAAELPRPGATDDSTQVSAGQKDKERGTACVGDKDSDVHVCVPGVEWPL